MLTKRAWGQGYATEAAIAIKDYATKHLGLSRIVALIHPANTKSERVALKIGLRYEKDTIRPNSVTMSVYALNYKDYQ
jgi:RimJ/RimL family protein N-acetyltransferase